MDFLDPVLQLLFIDDARVSSGSIEETVIDPIGAMFERAAFDATLAKSSDPWEQDIPGDTGAAPEPAAPLAKRASNNPLLKASRRGRVRLVPIQIDGDNCFQTYDFEGNERSLIPVR